MASLKHGTDRLGARMPGSRRSANSQRGRGVAYYRSRSESHTTDELPRSRSVLRLEAAIVRPYLIQRVLVVV
jgi:hypothetical protein